MLTLEEYQKTCRICCSSERSGQMLSPCNCKGTLSYVHSYCLINWIDVSQSDECEVCLTEYECNELATDYTNPKYPSLQTLFISSLKIPKNELKMNCYSFLFYLNPFITLFGQIILYFFLLLALISDVKSIVNYIHRNILTSNSLLIIAFWLCNKKPSIVVMFVTSLAIFGRLILFLISDIEKRFVDQLVFMSQTLLLDMFVPISIIIWEYRRWKQLNEISIKILDIRRGVL